MTVRELIDELEEHPGWYEVLVSDEGYVNYEIIKAEYSDNGVVYLDVEKEK